MGIVKELLFNDGEGLDFNDLNKAQRFLRAQMNDFLIGRRTRNADHIVGSTTFCFGVGVGGHVENSATALRSVNIQGVVAQCLVGAVTGDDPKTLAYYLADNELQTDHGAAHATLDRWDIVCIKLEHTDGDSESRDFKDAVTGLLSSTTPNKRRRVTLTKQVVVGANAAAGTAVEPAVPAGFVKWAAVFIPATYAAAFVPATHFRDYRMPCGGIASQLVVAGPQLTNHSFGTVTGRTLFATAAAQEAVAYLPRLVEGRVLRLQVRAKISVGGSIKLLRSGLTELGSTTVISPTINTGGVDATYDIIQSGGRIDSNALYGPLWTHGYSAGPAVAGAFEECLAVQFISGAINDSVTAVHCHVATG